MKKAPGVASQDASAKAEDIRGAYAAAVQMVAYEGQKRWSATSVFVQLSITIVAASLVPAFIPGLGQQSSSLLGLLLSVVGFFASAVWLMFLLRYEKITYYWLLSARELEGLMTPEVRSFQRGKDFASGEAVHVAGEQVGYKGAERLPERWGLPAIYAFFILVFVLLIALNVYRMCQPGAIPPAA